MVESYPSQDIIVQANADTRDVCVQTSAPRVPIASVAPQTPADDAGFEAGCFIVSVDGRSVRDIIDWRWLTSENVIEVGYIDLDGEEGTVRLERAAGEDWGFEFEGVVFDGVKQCRNACTFCFMRQLPDNMRPSLTLRDDDFRLSFLTGTFVTFTNLDSEDEKRIIEQHISPLRVSLHAADAVVRRRMIGKHAQHGFEVFTRLLDAGIEFHVQIVLVPGQNDGSVLQHTLSWAYGYSGILDVCVVPLGFTRYQNRFEYSFNNPAAACAVLDILKPFQRCAQKERGDMWVFAADEFYRNAYGADLLQRLPCAEDYGNFGMFEDGVGIIRSFVDDWRHAEQIGLVGDAAKVFAHAHTEVCYVVGFATREFLEPLVAGSGLAPYFKPLFVKNDFFGGNVDVTGLLCGCDIVRAIINYVSLQKDVWASSVLFAVPRVVFNDDGVTLDDMTLEDIEKRSRARVAVVSCNASDYLVEIINIIKRSASDFNERFDL